MVKGRGEGESRKGVRDGEGWREGRRIEAGKKDRGREEGWREGRRIEAGDTDENISPVENPIFAILTKIHL